MNYVTCGFEFVIVRAVPYVVVTVSMFFLSIKMPCTVIKFNYGWTTHLSMGLCFHVAIHGTSLNNPLLSISIHWMFQSVLPSIEPDHPTITNRNTKKKWIYILKIKPEKNKQTNQYQAVFFIRKICRFYHSKKKIRRRKTTTKDQKAKQNPKPYWTIFIFFVKANRKAYIISRTSVNKCVMFSKATRPGIILNSCIIQSDVLQRTNRALQQIRFIHFWSAKFL